MNSTLYFKTYEDTWMRIATFLSISEKFYRLYIDKLYGETNFLNSERE